MVQWTLPPLWVVWVYDEDGPRTNNHVEGWHNKLNKIAGQSPQTFTRWSNYLKLNRRQLRWHYDSWKLGERFQKQESVQEHTEIVFLSQSPVIRWIYVVLNCKLYPPVKSNTSFVSRTVMKIEQNEQNKNKNKLKTAITSAYWEWQVVTTRK